MQTALNQTAENLVARATIKATLNQQAAKHEGIRQSEITRMQAETRRLKEAREHRESIREKNYRIEKDAKMPVFVNLNKLQNDYARTHGIVRKTVCFGTRTA